MEDLRNGKIEWVISKDDEYIRVIINNVEYAKLPLDIFSEEEAIEKAKYNIVNCLVSQIELLRYGIVRAPLTDVELKNRKPIMTFCDDD